MNQSLKSIAMKYGIVTGLLLSIHQLIAVKADLIGSVWFGWLSTPILIAIIILATIEYRKTFEGPFLYKNALGTGLMVCLWAGIIAGVFGFILVKFIDPTYFERIQDIAFKRLEENPAFSEEQLEQTREQMKQYMGIFQNPYVHALQQFTGTLLWGAILTLLTSIFLKRKGSDDTPSQAGTLDS